MVTASELYDRLFDFYGEPRWWSEDPYRVMVQSVLVQNTAWSSVEKTTAGLEEYLKPDRIAAMPVEQLQDLIRPCGFAKAKSAAIQRLTRWYAQYSYQQEQVMALSKEELRGQLLDLKGIGAETADVLMVFAFHKPSFVVDAYTRRLLTRLGFVFKSDDEIRNFFENDLPGDYRIYGWFHWLILEHGIARCKKTPQCRDCPFENCHYKKGE